MAEKPKPEKKEAPKSETIKKEDKVLIIPLRHPSRRSAKNMRKNRAVREIRAFLARHMRAEPSNVMISQQLNEHLWKGGLHNTPAKIKVRVSTDEEGKIFARLLDEKERAKKERKKPGLRERFARRREGTKEERPATAKPEPKPETKEKPAAPKPEEKKPAPAPKEEPAEQEEIFEEDLK
jgi:ribosomal protein L31E